MVRLGVRDSLHPNVKRLHIDVLAEKMSAQGGTSLEALAGGLYWAVCCSASYVVTMLHCVVLNISICHSGLPACHEPCTIGICSSMTFPIGSV